MPTIIGATHASDVVQAIDAYGIPLLFLFFGVWIAVAALVEWMQRGRR